MTTSSIRSTRRSSSGSSPSSTPLNSTSSSWIRADAKLCGTGLVLEAGSAQFLAYLPVPVKAMAGFDPPLVVMVSVAL